MLCVLSFRYLQADACHRPLVVTNTDVNASSSRGVQYPPPVVNHRFKSWSPMLARLCYVLLVRLCKVLVQNVYNFESHHSPLQVSCLFSTFSPMKAVWDSFHIDYLGLCVANLGSLTAILQP